jgi:hypothetical protein
MREADHKYIAEHWYEKYEHSDDCECDECY